MNEAEALGIVKERGYLTINQAKSVRCDEFDNQKYCKWWHYTCRRCGKHIHKHLILIGNKKRMLCKECNVDYEEWYRKTHYQPYKNWWDRLDSIEKNWELESGTLSPIWILDKSKVGEFVRQCQIIEADNEFKPNVPMVKTKCSQCGANNSRLLNNCEYCNTSLVKH